MALHFAAGGSATEVASAGFNLVDVQHVDQVNELPDGTKAMVWLNEGEGVTQSFIDKVTPFLGNPKVFGFFLVDEPDPTGQYHTQVDAEDLKAESDWIHSRMPEAKTFITAMDMGSAAEPDFSNTYNYDNTHIDLFGIDPYPVRTGTDTVDYDMIDRTVAAAVESGIPTSAIVPVYQTFGGGNYTTNTGGKYVMPTTDQLETMMDHWEQLVPNPAFDFAYAWGSQEGDTALESSPELQAVFREHNLATPTPVPDVATPTPTPVPDLATPTPTPVPDLATPTPTPVPDGGNDDYYVDNVGDRVIESSGQGQDRVWTSVDYALSAGSSIEVLGTTEDAGTTAINLTGNELAQTIQGNAGANVINGGGGADKLSGFGGNDVFVFNSALGDGNIDRITDFNSSQNKIHLDDAIFAGLSSGALSSDAFFAGKAADDSSDHIIYNSSTGALSFDSDGIGGAAQTQFASLSPSLSLTAASFFVT
jgi:serralysin